MEKRLVTLIGGHSDGEMIYVDPTRQRLAETWTRGEGRWDFEDHGYVTRLVDFDIYERVDEDTFQVAA